MRFDGFFRSWLQSLGPEALATVGLRGDANESAMFARQLETIFVETYDVLYPDLKARMLFPLDNRVSPASPIYTYRQFDKFGEAKIIHDYAQDLPNVDVRGREYTHSVAAVGTSYQYSIQDLRAAAMAGLPLDQMKADAARYVMEQKLESLAAIGDSTLGYNGTAMTGFTNAPSILDSTSLFNGTRWDNGATVAQILADLNAMQKNIFTTTKGVFTPDTLVLPTVAHGILSTTARSPTFTDDSILQYVLKQSPWLKSIEFWPKLDNAGASAYGRVMMYKKDPKVVQLAIPQPFEQFAPQPVGLAFKVPCHMRVGGVVVRYPAAVTFMDGCVH